MEIKSPLKAIRAFCLKCMGGSKSEVEKCSRPECPVFIYRFGKNPRPPKRVMTDEQQAAAKERLAKIREKRK